MPKSVIPIEGWPEGIRAVMTTRSPDCELVQPVLPIGSDIQGSDFEGFNLGAHVGDDPRRVAAHRQSLAATIAADPVWLHQIHGAEVLRLEASHRPVGKDQDLAALVSRLSVDAVVTQERGLAACIMAADCLPVLAATMDGQWVGAAHAGWRGLSLGVLENLLQSLTDAQPQCKELVVWLGPCIGPTAFEVGEEVLHALRLSADDALVSSSHRKGHFYLDLAGLAARRMAAWALSKRIALRLNQAGQACTWTESERFFSHRRSAPCGRMAFLIWREQA
jgi:YfiH family protein